MTICVPGIGPGPIPGIRPDTVVSWGLQEANFTEMGSYKHSSPDLISYIPNSTPLPPKKSRSFSPISVHPSPPASSGGKMHFCAKTVHTHIYDTDRAGGSVLC